MYTSIMKTLLDLGQAVADRRKALHLRQGQVAAQSGITQETLSRLEHGQLTDLGARKILAVLAVLGLELSLIPEGTSGSLDELRRERGAT
jgi:transcriptional regulator with XRE-family HTH domain